MKYFKPLYTQFKALQLRERVLAIAALMGIIYFLFDFALIRPQQGQARQLRERIAKEDAELDAQKKLLQALAAQRQLDPLAVQRTERDALRKTFGQAETVITNASANTNMGDTVRAMVSMRPGVTLVSLKTLPMDVFFRPAVVTAAPAKSRHSGFAPAPSASAASAAASAVTAAEISAAAVASTLPTLYRHGIQVTVQGSYPALVSYMQEMERNANGIFWNNVKLEVTEYPDAKLTLVVYTLSARPDMPLG